MRSESIVAESGLGTAAKPPSLPLLETDWATNVPQSTPGGRGPRDHGRQFAEGALGTPRPPSQPRRNSRTLLMAAVAVIAFAGLFLAIRYGYPRDVDHLIVASRPFVVDQSGPGTLSAINKAAISVRIQGRITAVRVEVNEKVDVGQVVAEIASDDLQARLQSSIAAEEAAKLAVTQAQAQQDRAESAAQNANATLQRQSALLKQQAVSQSAYDNARASARQAEADLAASKASVAQARAQERSAAATVALNRADLADAVVRAPFAGIVISRSQNVGDMTMPGTPIVEIVDPETIVLSARFDESAIAAIRQGQKADLSFSAQPDTPIAGHVLRVNRQVDSETREFTVDVKPDKLPESWAIGERGTAVISIAAKPSVIAVPTADVVRRDGQAGVWTTVGGRARWTPVELGEIGGARVEVRSGLRNGDVVLAPRGVYAGMRVARTRDAR